MGTTILMASAGSCMPPDRESSQISSQFCSVCKGRAPMSTHTCPEFGQRWQLVHSAREVARPL